MERVTEVVPGHGPHLHALFERAADLRRAIRSTSNASKRSRTSSTTTKRLAAMQLCPELIRRLFAQVVAAASRSASARTR